ncbi:MAG: hypothetical protein HUU06_06195 [Planctomycetaceae bacterium]|nr:hypothetical protein [Planctomycetaceae bacterium]
MNLYPVPALALVLLASGCRSLPGPADRAREEFRAGNLPGSYRILREEGASIPREERSVLLLDLGAAFADGGDRIRAEWCCGEAARAGREAEGLWGIAWISVRRGEGEATLAGIDRVIALPACPPHIVAEARLHRGAVLVSLGREEEGRREWETLAAAGASDPDPAVGALGREAERRLGGR